MATVTVQKIEKTAAKPMPLFEEIERRMEEARRRAFGLFETRGRELGHALDDWLKAEHEVMGWSAAKLKETDSKYELEMTLPGYDPSDVQVTVTPSEIIVHADVKHEAKKEEAKCVWTEFGSNDVYRRVVLPQRIDCDKAQATLEKGMLHITAQKVPQAAAKPIEVRAA